MATMEQDQVPKHTFMMRVGAAARLHWHLTCVVLALILALLDVGLGITDSFSKIHSLVLILVWTFLTIIVAVVTAILPAKYIGALVMADDPYGQALACFLALGYFAGVGISIANLKNLLGLGSGYAIVLVIMLIIDIVTASSMKDQVELENNNTASNASSETKNCCTICQKPSIYVVCMECERKYQREIQRVRSQNWRAKKASEPATLTIAEWLQTLESFHYRCAYCQIGPYELMEHYIPIGQGKKDGGTTALNCVPSCFKCNTQKSNRHPGK